MNKTRKEIECLTRLQQLGGNVDNILDFLHAEELMGRDEVRKVRLSPEATKDLQLILTRMQAEKKFQLLEYEWTVLPVERIKITIVTDRVSQEFSYGF